MSTGIMKAVAGVIFHNASGLLTGWGALKKIHIIFIL